MITALGTGGSDSSWLEPSFGRGVFLESLHHAGVFSDRITAVDLDKLRAPADRFGEVVRGVDFLEWANNSLQRFDRIVGNPPFVAIHNLPARLRQQAETVMDFSGGTIGPRSNTWYAFLLASLRLLNDRGHIAFVLPAACEYADYSQSLRSQITSLFDRVDLIRSRQPLFEGVQDGSAILLCRTKGGQARQFRRHQVRNLDEAVARLRHIKITDARTCPPLREFREEFVPLGEVLSFRLGGVTGDSRYFLLTEQQRSQHRLPLGSVTPVVTKCWHVKRSHVGSKEWKQLRGGDARVWLFNPPDSLLNNKAVKRYLELSEEQGGCRRNRYKIDARKPWYRTPMPVSPHAFVSGMSNMGPWLCLNRMRGLNATNTLYVATFKKQISMSQRFAWALSCMTTPAMQQIRRAIRVYADGLRKIEPGQLSNLLVPVPGDMPNAEHLYGMAFKSMAIGRAFDARTIADAAILGQTRSPSMAG